MLNNLVNLAGDLLFSAFVNMGVLIFTAAHYYPVPTCIGLVALLTIALKSEL